MTEERRKALDRAETLILVASRCNPRGPFVGTNLEVKMISASLVAAESEISALREENRKLLEEMDCASRDLGIIGVNLLDDPITSQSLIGQLAQRLSSIDVALSPSGEAPKYPAPGPFPTPEQMLKGAGDLECIATGIRDAVAGRVTPIEEIDPSFRGPAEPEDLPTIAEMSGLCEAGQLPAIAELSPPEPARERLHNPEAGAEAWWSKDGRFIDPDTSDVDWFDKRKELSKLGFVAGYHNALSVLWELRRQDAAMLPAERAEKP